MSGCLWITLSAIFLAVEVGLSVWFWCWLTTEGESASTTIRNIGFVMAGTVALPLAIWRGLVANGQASSAQRQAETAQNSLLTERYERGAEMLGNAVLSVRLGGVYALERLAAENPEEYHLQVMKLFCAFVRNPTKDESIADPIRPQFMTSELREDIQATLTAIGRRGERGIGIEVEVGFTPLDLHGADLTGADLAGLNLAGADLRQAKLARANFMNANLAGALLAGANLFNPYYRADVGSEEALMESVTQTRLIFNNANVSGTYFSLEGMYPASGIFQEQLDYACADPDEPPKLDGVYDMENGEQLVWRGKTCNDEE